MPTDILTILLHDLYQDESWQPSVQGNSFVRVEWCVGESFGPTYILFTATQQGYLDQVPLPLELQHRYAWQIVKFW